MECMKHPDNQVISVCMTCKTVLVCLNCMTGSHTGHVFVKTEEAAKNIKSELHAKKVTNEKFIQELQSDIQEITIENSKHECQHRANISTINAQRITLHKVVDEIADNLIESNERNIKDNCERVEKTICDILSTIENVKRDNFNLNKILDDKDDASVLKSSEKLEDVVRTRPPFPKTVTVNFVQRKVDKNYLKLMFGGNREPLLSPKGAQAAVDFTMSTAKGSDFEGTLKRNRKNVVLESSFQQCSMNFVAEMYHWSNKLTWCRSMQEKKIDLVNRTGHVEKTVSFATKIRGMTGQISSGSDSLLVCGVEDKVIKRIQMPDGKVTTAFSTGNLYPYDICAAPNGDFFVTLVDNEDYAVTYGSERVLVQFASDGREIGRICHDSHGDMLFIIPRRIRTSQTGDIVGVKNSTDSENNHLVLLSTNLTLQSRYLGEGKVVSREKFDTITYKPDEKYAITDFLFDSADNIFICENYSRCVLMLTKDCLPLSTLVPTQESIPASISLYGDNMWIGFNDGTVNVYKFQ